jgi:hypothetical protein
MKRAYSFIVNDNGENRYVSRFVVRSFLVTGFVVLVVVGIAGATGASQDPAPVINGMSGPARCTSTGYLPTE